MQDLMKPTEVARQLGVSRSWLYDAAKAGRIPSIRIGGEDGPRWIDDARVAWRPGRSTAVTRAATAAGGSWRQSSRQAPPDGQQCLL